MRAMLLDSNDPQVELMVTQPQATERISRVEVAALWMLVFVTSIVSTGYAFCIDNHAIQLPLLDILRRPHMYADDQFVATLPEYPTIFWHLLSAMERLCPREPLLLAIFVVERCLLLLAGADMARSFVQGDRLAQFCGCCIFALGMSPVLGQGTIEPSYLEQTGFVIPILLFALSAFIRGRLLRAAVLLGVGASINILYAMFAVTFMGALVIALRLYPTVRQAWTSTLACCLFGIPGVYMSILCVRETSSNPNLWVRVALLRFPHHLQPFSWSFMSYANSALLVAVCLVVTYRLSTRPIFRIAVAISLVYVMWMIVAILTASVVKEPYLLTLHPARGGDLWFPIAGIITTSSIATKVVTHKSNSWRLFGLLALTFLLWSTIEVSWVLLWTAISSVAMLVLTLFFKTPSRPVTYYCRLLVVFLAIFSGQLLVSRKMLTGGWWDAMFWRPKGEIVEISAWVRSNTESDSVILVDPSWSTFRPLSQRSVYVCWKDASAILWDKAYLYEWLSRINSLHVSIDSLSTQDQLESIRTLQVAYEQLSDRDVRLLNKTYGVGYWIVPNDKLSRLPTRFSTEHYRVLQVDN